MREPWHRSLVVAVVLLLFSIPARSQQYIVDWIRTQPADLELYSRGTSILATRDGGILTAGSIKDADGEPDYLVLKYDAAGESIWTARYASSRQKNNFLRDVTLDPFGNILLTGNADTVKLDSFGNRIWSASVSGRSIAANSSRLSPLPAFRPSNSVTMLQVLLM